MAPGKRPQPLNTNVAANGATASPKHGSNSPKAVDASDPSAPTVGRRTKRGAFQEPLKSGDSGIDNNRSPKFDPPQQIPQAALTAARQGTGLMTAIPSKGFSNDANQCYRNSYVILLLHSERLLSWIKNRYIPAITGLSLDVKKLKDYNKSKTKAKGTHPYTDFFFELDKIAEVFWNDSHQRTFTVTMKAFASYYRHAGFNDLWGNWSWRSMQDGSEFLYKLLSVAERSSGNLTTPGLPTLDEILKLEKTHRARCSRCSREIAWRLRIDSDTILNVPLGVVLRRIQVPDNGSGSLRQKIITLDDCIRSELTQLGDDVYRCHHCKAEIDKLWGEKEKTADAEYKKAIAASSLSAKDFAKKQPQKDFVKQMKRDFLGSQKEIQEYHWWKLRTLPEILLIKLDRTDYVNNNQVKIDDFVEIPEILDVKDYLDRSLSSENGTRYQLKGLVSHCGSHDAGHYVAYVLNNGQWVEYNDKVCSKVTWSTIVAEQKAQPNKAIWTPYQLLYERIVATTGAGAGKAAKKAAEKTAASDSDKTNELQNLRDQVAKLIGQLGEKDKAIQRLGNDNTTLQKQLAQQPGGDACGCQVDENGKRKCHPDCSCKEQDSGGRDDTPAAKRRKLPATPADGTLHFRVNGTINQHPVAFPPQLVNLSDILAVSAEPEILSASLLGQVTNADGNNTELECRVKLRLPKRKRDDDENGDAGDDNRSDGGDGKGGRRRKKRKGDDDDTPGAHQGQPPAQRASRSSKSPTTPRTIPSSAAPQPKKDGAVTDDANPNDTTSPRVARATSTNPPAGHTRHSRRRRPDGSSPLGGAEDTDDDFQPPLGWSGGIAKNHKEKVVLQALTRAAKKPPAVRHQSLAAPPVPTRRAASIIAPPPSRATARGAVVNGNVTVNPDGSTTTQRWAYKDGRKSIVNITTVKGGTKKSAHYSQMVAQARKFTGDKGRKGNGQGDDNEKGESRTGTEEVTQKETQHMEGAESRQADGEDKKGVEKASVDEQAKGEDGRDLIEEESDGELGRSEGEHTQEDSNTSSDEVEEQQSDESSWGSCEDSSANSEEILDQHDSAYTSDQTSSNEEADTSSFIAFSSLSISDSNDSSSETANSAHRTQWYGMRPRGPSDPPSREQTQQQAVPHPPGRPWHDLINAPEMTPSTRAEWQRSRDERAAGTGSVSGRSSPITRLMRDLHQMAAPARPDTASRQDDGTDSESVPMSESESSQYDSDQENQPQIPAATRRQPTNQVSTPAVRRGSRGPLINLALPREVPNSQDDGMSVSSTAELEYGAQRQQEAAIDTSVDDAAGIRRAPAGQPRTPSAGLLRLRHNIEALFPPVPQRPARQPIEFLDLTVPSPVPGRQQQATQEPEVDTTNVRRDQKVEPRTPSPGVLRLRRYLAALRPQVQQRLARQPAQILDLTRSSPRPQGLPRGHPFVGVQDIPPQPRQPQPVNPRLSLPPRAIGDNETPRRIGEALGPFLQSVRRTDSQPSMRSSLGIPPRRVTVSPVNPPVDAAGRRAFWARAADRVAAQGTQSHPDWEGSSEEFDPPPPSRLRRAGRRNSTARANQVSPSERVVDNRRNRENRAAEALPSQLDENDVFDIDDFNFGEDHVSAAPNPASQGVATAGERRVLSAPAENTHLPRRSLRRAGASAPARALPRR